MKLSWLATFLLLVSLAVVNCSDSEFSRVHRGFSSDEEDSVISGVDAGQDELEEAFHDVLYDESSSPSDKVAHNNIQQIGGNGARPLSCIDRDGDEVDWWFAYIEPGGEQYVYLSSYTVENQIDALPLDPNFLFNDELTSPLIKTIYHPDNQSDSSEVWLGWNDQLSDNKDAYGANIDPLKHAHAKGFYAINAVIDPEHELSATIGSYAILTSLPNFPQTRKDNKAGFGAAIKNRLPTIPNKIFESNLGTNGQHCLCLSFPRRKVQMRINKGVKEIPVNFNDPHVQFLNKYLKTFHPAIAGTNFDDSNESHFKWRRYFSVLNMPYPKAREYLDDSDLRRNLNAYNLDLIPSAIKYKEPAEDVFPLSKVPFHINANKHLEILKNVSRWGAAYASQNGCFDGTQDACLGSFYFSTTASQSPLHLQLFAKHGLVIMDLFDDWASLQVSQSQSGIKNHYTGQVVDRYGLLVQSWIDSSSMLPRKADKKIFDSDNKLVATVHIDNVSEIALPRSKGNPLKFTKRVDHSKWAVGFALDTFNNDSENQDKGLIHDYSAFNPLTFISDINRSHTQAKYSGKSQGRGGGILATGSINFWKMFLSFKPRTKQPKFSNHGKRKNRLLQCRLRAHTHSLGTLNSSASASLPLKEFRPITFKAFRLSNSEAQYPARASSFVSVLNEVSKFIQMTEFQSEHAAILAFKKLFQRLAVGKVRGSAKKAWDITNRIIRERGNHSCFLDWPKLFSLPKINLFRQIPALADSEPRIVKDKNGVLTAVSSFECEQVQKSRQSHNVSVQTDQAPVTEPTISKSQGTNTEGTVITFETIPDWIINNFAGINLDETDSVSDIESYYDLDEGEDESDF